MHWRERADNVLSESDRRFDMSTRKFQAGYTLIEIVVVIVIIAILATTAIRSMRTINDVTRVETTRQTLDRLAAAIVGDPNITSEGTRINYGYVGDIGSLPPNLDALVQNPGSYSTWRGPYVRDQYTSGGANTEFKKDGWGTDIAYTGGVTLTSTGNGSPIARNLANSADNLLHNRVTLVVADQDGNVPGTVYKDSVSFVLSYPDGSGGITTRSEHPDRNGYAVFDSTPIGQQTLRVIYSPANDTLTRVITINPGEDSYSQINLFRNVW